VSIVRMELLHVRQFKKTEVVAKKPVSNKKIYGIWHKSERPFLFKKTTKYKIWYLRE